MQKPTFFILSFLIVISFIISLNSCVQGPPTSPNDQHEHDGGEIIIDKMGLKSLNQNTICCRDRTSQNIVHFEHILKVTQAYDSIRDFHADIILFDGSSLEQMKTLETDLNSVVATMVDSDNDYADFFPQPQPLPIPTEFNWSLSPDQNNTNLVLDTIKIIIDSLAILNNSTLLNNCSPGNTCEIFVKVKLELQMSSTEPNEYVTEIFFPHNPDNPSDHHGKGFMFYEKICAHNAPGVGGNDPVIGKISDVFGNGARVRVPWFTEGDDLKNTIIKVITTKKQIRIVKPSAREIKEYQNSQK